MGNSTRSVRIAMVIAMLFVVSLAHAALPVLQRGYDPALSGAQLDETVLTPANVTPSKFGLVFRLSVDDNIYAQPLYVPNVAVQGRGTRNVVYVATMGDTLYAFDADSGGTALWSANFATRVGAMPVPMAQFAFSGNRNIIGNLGILSTPVIDASTNILYLVACTLENNTMVYRLHAVDIRSGTEPYGAGTVIAGSYGGSTFDARYQTQRVSLTLAGNKVVIGFGAVELEYAGGYVGWMMAYDKRTLKQTGRFATITKGTRGGGVWQSGRAPAVDGAGNVYVFVGNGYVQGYDGVDNFAESVLKLDASNGLKLVDWFTPKNWSQMDAADSDLTSSGPLLIPSKNLLIGGGKTGDFYLLNSTNLGKFDANDAQIVQKLRVGASQIHGGPVFWNRSTANGGSRLYNWASSDWVKAFKFSGNVLAATPASQGSGSTFFPGGLLALSANGQQPGSGVLWATTTTAAGASNNPPGPGVLHAFDADDVSTELWNSNMNAARDAVGNLAKFVPPLIANGRVYVASSSRRVSVYGRLTGYTVSPSSIAFGNQLVNTSSVASAVTVSNLAGTALSITSIKLSGTGAASYSQTNNCGASLGAGASCTVNVVFKPTAAGAAAATLTVNAGGGAGSQTVALSGTGTVASFSLSASTLGFGDQLINTVSPVSNVTLTNSGAVALPVNGITISGSLSRPFAQTNNCGASVAAGATCTIGVTFNPTSTGALTATLTIDAGNGAGTRSVSLSGNGISVSVSVTPSSIDFGDQQVGRNSAPRTVTITNSGTQSLPAPAVGLSGAGSQPFSQTNNCTGPLPAGASCAVSVVFNPASTGAATATLDIDAGSAGTRSVALSGNGIIVSFDVAPSSVSFGRQAIGSAATPTTVTITNTGTVALPVTNIALSGSAAFSQTNGCDDPLPPDGTCSIEVGFTPAVAGDVSATLTFDAGSQSSSVALSGTGTFEVTLTASSQRLTAGSPVTLTWTSTPGAVCTASGGTSGDNWEGTLADNGSREVTEPADGSRDYGLSCTAGNVTATAMANVVFTLPAVTLSADASSLTLGKSVTLTWSASDAESCTASDGQSGDGWSGSKPLSGSLSVTPKAAGTVSYTLSCSSGSKSAQVKQQVTVSSPPAASGGGGGGGALDGMSVLALLALAGLRQRRRD